MGKFRRSRRFSRAVAAVCAGVVLVLAVLAACPELHHWLHGERATGVGTASAPAHPSSHLPAADEDDDGCAVTLFAQGLVVPLTFLALVVVGWILRQPPFRACERPAPSAPRFTLLPSQGPPAAA